jgi:hypothetical protein
LLLAYSIEMAIQEAAKKFELGRVGADYKLAWTDHIRVENEILFSSNWKGDFWIECGNFERGLKSKFQKVLNRSS